MSELIFNNQSESEIWYLWAWCYHLAKFFFLINELKTMMPEKSRGDLKAQSRGEAPELLHDPTKNTEETQLTWAPVPSWYGPSLPLSGNSKETNPLWI